MMGPGIGPGEAPAGRGGGFAGHGGGHGGMMGPGAGPGGGPSGPEIQRGHGPGGGEELRPPGAGHGGAHHDHAASEVSEISDDESSAHSNASHEESDPILANGEFDPRHQFNVPPADNTPRGGANGNVAARRVPHDNRRRDGTPEGWNSNAGGVAATLAGRGGGVYARACAGGYVGAHGSGGREKRKKKKSPIRFAMVQPRIKKWDGHSWVQRV